MFGLSWPRDLSFFRVAPEEIQRDSGVRRIVLGATGREGTAVLRQGVGVDWVDHEAVVLEERRHDRAMGELEHTAMRLPAKRSRRWWAHPR
jgi:hypothetical protein